MERDQIITNYDRIREMSIDEMTDALYALSDRVCYENCMKTTGNQFECPVKGDITAENCKQCMKRWLESKVS